MKQIFTLFVAVCIVLSASVSADDFSSLLTNYMEYYETLDYFSEKALQSADHTTPEYHELYFSGHFLREQTEKLREYITHQIQADPEYTISAFRNHIAPATRELPNPGVLYLQDLVDLNIEILTEKSATDALRNQGSLNRNLSAIRNFMPKSQPKASPRVLELIGSAFAADDVDDSQGDTIRSADHGIRGAESAVRGYDSRFFRIVMTNNGRTPFLSQSDFFLNPGEIILTFDDGPTTIGNRTRDITQSMIDHGYPGIFFVLGSKINSNTRHLIEMQNRIADVSVHGWNHATRDGKPFTAMSLGATLGDIGRTFDAIRNITGKSPRFFRAPYGVIGQSATERIISDYRLVPLGWTIDSQDWSTKNSSTLLNNMINMIQRRGKGILLLHDIHEQSRVSWLRLAGWLKDHGYTVLSPDVIVDRFFRGSYTPPASPPASASPAAGSGTIGQVTAQAANVRSGPSTDHHIVSTIQRDTRVEILERVQGSTVGSTNIWYRIKIIHSGVTGYIFGNLISF